MHDGTGAGSLDGERDGYVDVAADELDERLLDDRAAAGALLCASAADNSTAAAVLVGYAKDLEVLQGDELGALIFAGEGDVFAVGGDGGLDDQAGAGVDDVDDGVEEADAAAVEEVAILGER